MASMELDITAWAEQNFGTCELGDKRRTRRAVALATQVASHPDGSTPTQTEIWGECKAAYRLFDQDDVTFQRLCEPHWQLTRARQGGTWLLIGDTTEIDFRRDVPGLGPTGNGGGHGFFLHSSLMIHSETEELVGLAGAELFHRKPVPKKETAKQKRNRPRESEVWGRVVDLVGPPPEGTRFVHIFDAGADNYEVFCRLKLQQNDWVVRVAQADRIVLDTQGTRVNLTSLVQQQPLAGVYELHLRSRQDQPARTARIEVRLASLSMPVPVQKTPFMKACGITEIAMWAVEAREVEAPEGVEPLHWILLTSEVVEEFDDAYRVIGWYEKRPVIEDYHKCLKTGCRVESRQYETSARLERVTGLLSIVAVRLLYLKFVARTDPDRPAKHVVPGPWIEMLQSLRKGKPQINTVSDFFRSLAMLGGFLGRKGDGQPGWITIWRGLDKLILCIRGAETMRQKCG